ncbi:hypothetical protein NL676_031586 [Syzygium grande]|nr:hypothetical protein NL676_031586 [Syzygium grande]
MAVAIGGGGVGDGDHRGGGGGGGGRRRRLMGERTKGGATFPKCKVKSSSVSDEFKSKHMTLLLFDFFNTGTGFVAAATTKLLAMVALCLLMWPPRAWPIGNSRLHIEHSWVFGKQRGQQGKAQTYHVFIPYKTRSGTDGGETFPKRKVKSSFVSNEFKSKHMTLLLFDFFNTGTGFVAAAAAELSAIAVADAQLLSPNPDAAKK